MRCTQCGTELPDNMPNCPSCNFPGPPVHNDVAESPKTSKMAIASLLVAILIPTILIALLIRFPYIAIVAAGALVVNAFLAICLAIMAIKRIRRNRALLSGKALAIESIVISVPLLTIAIVFIVLLSFDADPPPDDYTIADLRCAPAEYAESWNILKTLMDAPDPLRGTGLSQEAIDGIYQVNKAISDANYPQIVLAITTESNNILKAWNNAANTRATIEKLDQFPEIADLTEPSYSSYTISDLRSMALLYSIYASLEAQRGNFKNAASELVRIDSVIRKFSVNSRTLINKLICYSTLAANIKTANFIVNDPNIPLETIETISGHFQLPNDDQLSLRNPMICEYLTCQNQMPKMPKKPFLKQNSSLRMHRNFCRQWFLESEPNEANFKPMLSLWPEFYPDSLNSLNDSSWFYRAYNPIGAILMQIVKPALSQVIVLKTRLQIKYDLLQIVLNKRLGKNYSLKDRDGNEYIVDVNNGWILRPVPDECLDSKEIKLMINPDLWQAGR